MSIRVQDILIASAQYYGLDEIDVRSRRRDHRLVRARQVTMFIARRMTTYSLPQIGAAMGGLDHTTVLHGVARIDEAIEEDAELAREVGEIADSLVIAEQAIHRMGIYQHAPEPSEVADKVLANPSRAAMQVSTEGIVVMAVAVRDYEARIAELEAAGQIDAGRVVLLEEIARHAGDLVDAARAAVRSAYDDQARKAATNRQREAFAALSRSIAKLQPQQSEETKEVVHA